LADSTPYGRRWWAGAGEKWRWCAKNMHDPNGLLDSRSASPRAPASIAAVGLEGILSEASSRSDERRKPPKQRTSKNRV